jgi:uridine kinase
MNASPQASIPQALVVAIAAPPGGGKTTLSKAVSGKLGGAPILHYDDYETFTQRSPAEMQAWLERGARVDEITVPGFAEELARLRASGAHHVVVDSPLGRAHPATADVIDLLIYIDTPFDVALARVMRGQAGLAAQARDAGAVQNFARWLGSYLDSYLAFTRRSYEVQRAAVLPQADLVLDGMLAPEELCRHALDAIAKRER